MKKVSVIIPFFNGIEQLRICLSALRIQTYPADCFEIAAVDNGSTRDTAEIRSEFPEVKWLCQKAPGSYAARNFGVEHTDSEIVAFTDGDCLPANSWLEESVRALEKSGATIIGGRIDYLNPKDRELNVYEVFEEEFFLLSKHRLLIEQRNIVATANVVAFRAVFERIGVFDPDLRNLGDGEWSRRAVARGEVLKYADAAVVRHPRRSTFGILLKKVRRVAGGRIVLMRKQKERPSAFLSDLYRNSVFSLRVHKYAIQFPRLTGLGMKSQMFVLVEIMSVVNSFEKIRVLLGSKSSRD